jgi:Na+/H+ antiporter NhaD/arsenite permease-like protein
MNQQNLIEIIAFILFILALIHTFLAKKIHEIGGRFKQGSVQENIFHLLGEIEVVFGFWAGIFIIFYLIFFGKDKTISFLNNLNFTEPLFVFVIMIVCSTRPILEFAGHFIGAISNLLPIKKSIAYFFTLLSIGPVLGSFITEPAAMTVVALILKDRFFNYTKNQKFLYFTIAVLFVNISIGGTLTHFAAPPVLMVAHIWNWDTLYMFTHFGFKAMTAILINTTLLSFLFKKELEQIQIFEKDEQKHEEIYKKTPNWIIALHLIVLSFIILTSHTIVAFMGLFLFFLSIVKVTKEYQNELKLTEALLVAFFLSGLIVLGSEQRWWLEKVITSLSDKTLYFATTLLTAITDNAALTYLGAQVPDLSDNLKYALVSGAVSGGGLTVIANAPNPAGYGILKDNFGEDGISALKLFMVALLPTIVTVFCFLSL